MGPFLGGDQNHLLVKSLFDNGALSSPVFAFTIDDGEGYLDIGKADESMMSGPSDLKYLTIAENGPPVWLNPIYQVRTRDADNKVSKHYELSATDPQIDGVTSFAEQCIKIPSASFKQIMGLLLAHNSDEWWNTDLNVISVPDDAAVAKLPALEFLYGDYWVQVRPEDYMTE